MTVPAVAKRHLMLRLQSQKKLAKSCPRSLLELLRRPLAGVGLDAARRLDVKLLNAQESPSPSWEYEGFSNKVQCQDKKKAS